jgi:hypothetical protein
MGSKLGILAVVLMTVVIVSAQTNSNAPVFTDYRGISIGMTADEVRAKLDRIKKGDTLSDRSRRRSTTTAKAK